jgi:tetratricopeptide (TPR) repeat protein
MRSLIVAALAATIVVLPATGRTQPSDERSRCFARDGVSSADKISACTAVIESDRETTQGRAAAFNTRGNAHLGAQSFDLAAADYSEAIRLVPSNAVAFNNRGLARQRKGEIDRALEDLDTAIRLNPDYELAFVNRANARRIKGHIDLAIADGDRAIELAAKLPAPNLAAAFLARALAYQEKAQWDFDAYLADGRYEDRAIADYDEAIRLDPGNATAFRNRGAVNTKMQRYDRAIADFTDAVRLDPNVAAAFYGRAYALRFVGQYERAVADYRTALTLKLDDLSRRQIETILQQLGAADRRDVVPAAVSKR